MFVCNSLIKPRRNSYNAPVLVLKFKPSGNVPNNIQLVGLCVAEILALYSFPTVAELGIDVVVSSGLAFEIFLSLMAMLLIWALKEFSIEARVFLSVIVTLASHEISGVPLIIMPVTPLPEVFLLIVIPFRRESWLISSS